MCCRLCKRLLHIPLRCDEVIDKVEKKPFQSIQDRFLANGENNLMFKIVYPSRSVDLTADDIEFRLVESAFHRLSKNSFKIHFIEFVINPELQRKFQAKKAEFKQRNIPDTTIFAFHGTHQENIRSICQTNLTVINRYCQGYGYYFSEYPDFSMDYGNGLLMFKVLPGNEYSGTDNFSHYGPYAQYQSKKITAYSNYAYDPNSGYMQAVQPMTYYNPYTGLWQIYQYPTINHCLTGNGTTLQQVKDYGFELIIADSTQFVPYCIIHLQQL